MNGLSAAATILQLLQVAAQVSTALGQYVAAVKDAESSRSRLVDQITLMTTAAKAVGSVLQNPPSSRTPEQQALLKEWFRTEGSAARCEKRLEDLLSWLHNEVNSKKPVQWVRRFIWPVKENRIHAAIRAFEGHMPYFRDILSIDTSIRIQEITSIITSEREHIRNREIAVAKHEIATAKRKLLEWFDGLDCTVKHEFTREQRQKTTGEWLFNERLYTEWRESSFGLFWLSGKAGAGKSVLASGVIDTLSSGLADDETLAYFYCDFRNSRSTSTMEVLRSLAKQLLWNSETDWLPSFPELVVRKERGTGPPVDITTLSDLLKRAAELHQRPMIVIDALDECEDLSKLLDELVKLDEVCRFFVTSRPLHSLNRVFASRPSISLNDRVYAVQHDMYFHISTELESRDKLKVLSHDLQVEIRGALMEKADGMFRWVQCQLDRLNRCWSLGDVHEVLDTLPATLYETYDRMLRAIDKQEFGGRVARRALMWLVTALHPLALSQLAEALTIDRDNAVSSIPTMHETDIIEICGSLVSFNEQTRIITLSHYSVKEYLTSDVVADKTYFVHDARANFELASVSIYSIMFSIDKPEVGRTDLCYYAMNTGLNHLANCAPEDDDALLRLLFTFQNHVSDHRRSYASKRRCEDLIPTISQLALYTIIRFGHLSTLRHYLDHHSVQVTQGTNPLVYAAFYRDVPCVQLLLDRGLDVNIEATIRIARGYMLSLPPLIAATRNCKYQEELVTLLLAHGSTVPRNALHSVLGDNKTCKPFVIQVLLEHGADAMLLEAGGESCLHPLLRYSYGHPGYDTDVLEIARLLTGAGCDPAALDDRGCSAIHLALSSGAFQLVEWLVENGFQLPPDAILHAVKCEFTAKLLPMLHVLFENGVVTDVRDDHGNNALHAFLRCRAWQGFGGETEVAFKQLIDKGCNIHSKNHQGETPLHLAAKFSTSCAVDFLIEQGAELPDDIVNYYVAGARFGMKSFVRLVKVHGASCQARTIRGDNALHCLLSGDVKLCEPPKELVKQFSFLLQNGCDFYATGSSGLTVLGTAIQNGYLTIARILLDRFAQLHVDITLAESDPGDAEGNTILHRLCYKLTFSFRDRMTDTNFLDRVKLLQEAGYDLARHVNALNNDGYTPLGIVIQSRKHFPVIVSYLLQFGAKFSDVNPLFLDNLEWASDLPWYRNATEAYHQSLAKPKITFDDADTVYHILVGHCKLPVPAVRRIMDAAEYWAYTKALRENFTIQSAFTDDNESITLPVMPSINTQCWMPCRVMFSCKPRGTDHYVSRNIRLSVRHQNEVYAVRCDVEVESVPLEPPRTVFDVWDEHTPAVQLNGRELLAVKDLTCGNSLGLVFSPWEDVSGRVELEFFQIDMYFTMRTMEDSPSSMKGANSLGSVAVFRVTKDTNM
ncbi:hypothetical protein BU15DRAFT_77937 [Melanogaster broomeanus]|nr:hypothetical protein BU15DRAFT_77937 [Melanogaster broomeanus]